VGGAARERSGERSRYDTGPVRRRTDPTREATAAPGVAADGGGGRRRRLLALLGAGALSLLAAAACRDPAARPWRGSVVLVTIDTLRADHLGCYGYPRDTSPFLDGLAARSVRFENALSSSSNTAPSHASIMTSLQPFQHRLLKNGQALDPSLYTLAAMFHDAGYETAGFVSVGFLGELSAGFDHFDAKWRSGDQTVDHALAWLAARQIPARSPAAPFFLWVHLYDPHQLPGPRDKLQPDLEVLGSWPREEQDRFFSDLIGKRGVPTDFYPSREDLLHRYDVYDSGIRFADRQLRRLYERVGEVSPGARWVVTADHGEGLGNHHYDEHGRFLYDEQLRVPLIVAGLDGPPRRVDRLVRLVDVYPTLAGWIGGRLPEAPAIQGYPLLGPAGEARDLPPGFAFAQRRPKGHLAHHRGWEEGEIVALRSLDAKYVFHSQGTDEFFDLRRDPLELDNRIEEPSATKEALRQRLRAYLRTLLATAGRIDDRALDTTAHDEELKALGYL
jgi:choline-sulfatase